MIDQGKEIAAAAKLARDEGRIADALKGYGQAAEVARQQGNAPVLAHRLRHIGDIHREAGRDAEAAPFYAEALALYRGDPNPPPLDLANMLRPLAMLKEKSGDRAGAAALWAEAGALYAAAGVADGARESELRQAALGFGPKSPSRPARR
jgi:tetratricopeptide (TPR) repeat protein